jgi:hypothetical protein
VLVTPPSAPAPTRAARHAPPAAATAAAIAAAVAVAAALRVALLRSDAVITYDDGVYSASVDAMRHGALPYRDVFSSQGPLFLPLLRFASILGGGASWAPRLVPFAAGLAVVVLTHRLASRVADAAGALLAALLVATSGVILYTTSALAADGVAGALALGAVVAALRPSRRQLAIVAALAGAALAVKSLLVVPPVAAALWLVARGHGRRAAAAVLAGAVGLVVLLALPWGLGNVWNQYVSYHMRERKGSAPGGNLRLVRMSMWHDDRLLVAVVAAAGVTALVLVLAGRARHAPARPDDAREHDVVVALVLWIALAAFILLFHSPLFVQHLTVLVPPAAVLAARWRPPVVALVVIALLVVPGQGDRLDWRLSQFPADPASAPAVALLRAIEPEDARVISDDPGLAWQAGRLVPPALVDTSFERIRAGSLTRDAVVGAAQAPDVCAVVFWSGRFDALGGVRGHLPGYRVALADGARTVYLRDGCRVGTGVSGT